MLSSCHGCDKKKRMEDPNEMQAENVGIPAELQRQYEIRFKPRTIKTTPVRLISANQIGSLLQVQGIVTRITEVRPMVRVATYTCDFCGKEIYQTVSGRRYTPLLECVSEECKENKNKR